MKMYAIWDDKSQSYGTPFFAVAHGIAFRMFTELANDKNSTVGKYPDDFALYHLGDFDESTGMCISEELPYFLTRATSVLTPIEI